MLAVPVLLSIIFILSSPSILFLCRHSSSPRHMFRQYALFPHACSFLPSIGLPFSIILTLPVSLGAKRLWPFLCLAIFASHFWLFLCASLERHSKKLELSPKKSLSLLNQSSRLRPSICIFFSFFVIFFVKNYSCFPPVYSTFSYTQILHAPPHKNSPTPTQKH